MQESMSEASVSPPANKMQRRVWIENALSKLKAYSIEEIIELRKFFEGEDILSVGQISVVPLLNPPESLSKGEAAMFKELHDKVFKA